MRLAIPFSHHAFCPKKKAFFALETYFCAQMISLENPIKRLLGVHELTNLLQFTYM